MGYVPDRPLLTEPAWLGFKLVDRVRVEEADEGFFDPPAPVKVLY
jgi:hypothetical protein